MSNEATDGVPEAPGADEPHFLDDPDVTEAFERMLDEFSRETDRGASLVAADIVSEHLRKVIEELAPAPFKPKRVRELLNYPGPLNTFAARADIAFMAGFVNETAHRSIDLLRGLRNKAAHSQGAFRLGDYRAQLREMCDLGPGTAVAVNRFALDAIVQSFVSRVMDAGVGLEAKIGRNPFATPSDVIDHLSNRPDLTARLEDRLPRMELAFGVWLLLGLIAHQRKQIAATRASLRACQ